MSRSGILVQGLKKRYGSGDTGRCRIRVKTGHKRFHAIV